MPFLSYTQDFNDNLLMLLLRDSDRYFPIIEFFDTLTRDLSELSWAEAELIALEVSQTNGSTFCSGIREGMIKALADRPQHPGDDKLAAAIDFAHKVNRDPAALTQADVDRVLHAGWHEQTVEDIVGLVAIQRLYNTLASGLGFKALPAAAFAEIGRDTLEKGGYTASFQHFIGAMKQQ